MKHHVDIETFKINVKNSLTFWELARRTKIGKLRLLKIINDHNIDISHFTPGKGKSTRSVTQQTETRICPACNESFTCFINNKKRTCSKSCANSFFRSGKNHPNWKEINTRKSSYAKRICLKYHKRECVVCGEHNIIDIHHYDYNYTNNLPQNLIPLCPTHHRYIHSKHKKIVKDVIDSYVTNFSKNFINNLEGTVKG